MTKKEMHEIADIVIRKLLEAKERVESDLFNINDLLFTLINTRLSERELLAGELAKLMTLLTTYENKEEYEKAHLVKIKIDQINNKIDQIDNQENGNYD